jgi:hypothetical protein
MKRTPTIENRVVVVSGYSDAEHERAIAALITKGAAQEHDMFVCLMRFGERANKPGGSL